MFRFSRTIPIPKFRFSGLHKSSKATPDSYRCPRFPVEPEGAVKNLEHTMSANLGFKIYLHLILAYVLCLLSICSSLAKPKRVQLLHMGPKSVLS